VKAGRKQAGQETAEQPQAAQPITAAQVETNELEVLEQQIDEALIAARTLDKEGLESVISLLRRARNEVVWKLGQA
jgi:hypothetical protein